MLPGEQMPDAHHPFGLSKLIVRKAMQIGVDQCTLLSGEMVVANFLSTRCHEAVMTHDERR